jgi:hypothetical protein
LSTKSSIIPCMIFVLLNRANFVLFTVCPPDWLLEIACGGRAPACPVLYWKVAEYSIVLLASSVPRRHTLWGYICDWGDG